MIQTGITDQPMGTGSFCKNARTLDSDVWIFCYGNRVRWAVISLSNQGRGCAPHLRQVGDALRPRSYLSANQDWSWLRIGWPTAVQCPLLWTKVTIIQFIHLTMFVSPFGLRWNAVHPLILLLHMPISDIQFGWPQLPSSQTCIYIVWPLEGGNPSSAELVPWWRRLCSDGSICFLSPCRLISWPLRGAHSSKDDIT